MLVVNRSKRELCLKHLMSDWTNDICRNRNRKISIYFANCDNIGKSIIKVTMPKRMLGAKSKNITEFGYISRHFSYTWLQRTNFKTCRIFQEIPLLVEIQDLTNRITYTTRQLLSLPLWYDVSQDISIFLQKNKSRWISEVSLNLIRNFL